MISITRTAVTKSQIGLGSVDNVSAVSLRDRSTHTGTQPASTISDFDLAAMTATAASYIRFRRHAGRWRSDQLANVLSSRGLRRRQQQSRRWRWYRTSLFGSVGYPMRWEAGAFGYLTKRVYGSSREYQFADPSPADDATHGFIEGSRWVKTDGTTYQCSTQHPVAMLNGKT